MLKKKKGKKSGTYNSQKYLKFHPLTMATDLSAKLLQKSNKLRAMLDIWLIFFFYPLAKTLWVIQKRTLRTYDQ